MKNLDKLLEMIRATVKDLVKTPDSTTPKKWNCCDELVAPIDLEKHFLEKHLGDYQLSYEDKNELILIIWMISHLLILSFIQGK